ncbi:MAG: choice-of-anchor A family protein [Ignavibacteriales bacterium]|nr:choice-of-anchor A family protein [Ignavibacteriales bacterium]
MVPFIRIMMVMVLSAPVTNFLYKIVVNNISRAPVPDITVIDNLPVELNYVPNTTTFKDYNGSITQISDDGSGTAFPLDGSGKVINPSTSLPVGGSYEITFRATIKAFEDLPSGTVNIINTGTANALQSSVNFTSITPIFGRIGDKIWEDQNKNGLQDGSEPGISGVTVNLLNSTGDVVATVTTNPNGEYVFYGVLPGDYSVEFVLPSVYDFTAKNADGQNINGAANSDANPNNGRTDLFTLAGGERNLNIDAGMIPNGSIGDKVWDDLNMNGIQDGSEPGLENVAVQLYTCNDVLVASTTTNANGNYNFAQLAPGSYYVKFVTPSGYVFSALNQGGDDNADSDVNPSTGKTDCVNLVLGQDITSIDAGMNVAPSGSIGDYVWNDENGNGVQDNGEDGLEGITVKLYDCDNNLITSTSTAFDGSFSFSSVAAGSYYVKYILPSGYTFTTKDAGIDDSKDSDADPVTGKTSCFTVASGQNISTIDAGMLLNETDIEVLKTTSAATITCGQNYSYTITAKNNGPVDANNIIVNDVLPVGLVFVSATASQGSYSSLTGDWTVGSLTNGASATITINVSVDCSALNLVNIALCPAKPYTVFILRDLNQPSADTEGKLAVGGNATLSNYSVGDKLPNSNGAEDVLVVGGNLLYTSGRVYNGNVVYGGTTNLPISAVSIEEGTLRHDNTVIDFADAKTHLENLSTQLGGYASNGTTTFQWGTISLINNDPYLNVFTVNGNDLNNANSLEITVPNGSAVIVNILGTNLNWHGGLHVNGTAINNVIFNFPEATLLSISGIDVKGSLLAPFAHLNFPAGIITGQTIVKSMTGSGQFNLSPFLGNIPGNLTIVNVASLTGSDLPDSDHSNNSATAVSTYSPTSTGGGTGSGNWQQIGNFPAGQVVTCLESDGQGNIFAGTASGYIYKRIGNSPDWIHVNQNIYSGAIWALRMHSNGNLYAATVTGVYVGTNNGTAWALGSLQYKDVRTIKMDASGNLYAGTWGFGVYRSLDNGITWTQVNSGIGNNLIITGISVNSNNSLFVGTFGGGVFKSVDQGNNWVPVNMGYNFIWAIASDSDGDVFAGTYGDGLYRSTDNGSTWFKTTFPGTYVYEMRIDGNDNIFATSYSGGVFVSTDKGNTWASIGLGGFGLSSLLIVPNGSTPDAGGEGVIYGGTANGNIYMAVSSVMNIKSGKNTIPTEFSLDQNYPNPFNPSTVIRYSIPFDADVNITVYNTVGQEVTVLAKESVVAGIYSTSFDASNLPSGVYLYRMTAVSSDGKQKFTSTKKMILVK